MASNQRLSKQRRLMINNDVLKAVGVLLTVQASLGVCLIEGSILNLGALTEAEAQAKLLGGGGTAVAMALLMRMGGYLAWPLFAFLTAQGYLYTSNTKNYLLRMLAFAVLSEVPYDLAMSGSWLNWGDQNVLFSLLIGLMGLVVSEELCRRSNSYFPRWAMLVGCTLWALLLKTQFGFLLVPSMFAFFYLEERELLRDGAVIGLCAVLLYLTGGLVGLLFVIPVALALIPLHWFNDKAPVVSKWVWYSVYLAHLVILAAIVLFA